MSDIEKTELFKVGDRIEYVDHLKFQLGGERLNEQGVVVDVLTGEMEQAQMVFTRPDSAENMLGTTRVDFVILGTDEPIRLVR